MEQGVLIREFRPGDARAVVSLHRDSEECFEEMAVDESFILQVAARSDYRFFVAEASGRVVGFCGVLFFSGFGRAEVGPIAVEGGMRRRLVASLLLERVVSFLGAAGIRRLIARVKAGNTGSTAFFCASGFEPEGFFRRYTKRNEDVVQLVRLLA